MLLDISPLRHNTAFRRLFTSQCISGLGTMVSYVAVPWQLYQLTHSNAQVGLLGLVQLVPVVVCGLLGGAVADRVDRKRLLIGSEALMALCLADPGVDEGLHATDQISAVVIVARRYDDRQIGLPIHRSEAVAASCRLAPPSHSAEARGGSGSISSPSPQGPLFCRVKGKP